ncbi:SDR family oxidoreductase [Aeoliella sp. SH292]|uniref:SDR family oxidoreductase n=1 Tax=Aeoliella sp. SH292 TaxID=3454464 RepID=UPI003F9A1FE6
MGFTIEKKVALVTGANRGIGKTIVETLLAAGASKVYVGVRKLDSADELVAAHGAKVVPVRIDMEDADSIKSAAHKANDVSLVINNAGVYQGGNPLDSDFIESTQYQLNVNAYGQVRMAQAFAPVLKAHGGGAFVQINSVASLRSFPGFAAYCASKAAAYSITQALHLQLTEQGTQVLSVHPGPIRTDMSAQAGLDEVAEPASVVADGIIAALAAGDYHLFPDSLAKQYYEQYQPFATNIVEAITDEV